TRFALQPPFAGLSSGGRPGSHPLAHRGGSRGGGDPGPFQAGQADTEKTMIVRSPDKGWNEECGIVAAVGVPRAAEVVRPGLHALKHRGQESTGIVSADGHGEFHVHKGIGLVADVYTDQAIAQLPGALAIGHNRYSTSGSITLENTQPLRVVYRSGPLALAH